MAKKALQKKGKAVKVESEQGAQIKKIITRHHSRTMPDFIAGLIVVLGVLNIVSVFLLYVSKSLDFPSFTFSPAPVQEAGEFIHITIGMMLIWLGYQLYHRRRGAWTVIFVYLVISLIASVLGGTISSYITGFVTLYIIVVLLIYRDEFTTPSIFRLSPKRMSAVLFAIFMVIFGIVGSRYLGADFDDPIDSWTSAIYFTISTITTVGFGDYVPITANAQWFTIILMVFGFASFLVLIGTLIGPYVEGRIQKVIQMVGGIRAERLSSHLIICGLSTEARILLESLKEKQYPFVVVCGSEARQEELVLEGINIVAGDPSEKEVLERVAIKKAKALLAISDDDALNAFITITAREMAPKLPIIAMVKSRENMKKLRSVGATRVISPSVIGAERILNAALGDDEGPGCR